MASADPPPPGSPVKASAPVKKLVVLLLATTLGLAVAELLLAGFYRPPSSIRFQQDVGELNRMGLESLARVVESDDELFWRLTPSTRLPRGEGPFFGVIANSQGVREDHLVAGSGPPRVLFLGDSCTFGYGLDHSEAYVQRAEVHLRQRGLEVECINAGVPGYTLFQGWRYWETRGHEWRPDVVVACFGWNDASAWDGLSDFEHARYARACRPPQWLRWSRVCQLTARTLARRPRSEGRRPRLLASEFADLLDELRASVERRGARLVVVSWPIRPQVEQADFRSPWQQATYAFAERQRVPVLDLVPRFRRLVEERDADSLFLDQGHGTALANDHVGGWMAETLVPLLASTGSGAGQDSPVHP